jgi:hypothetical protein
MILSVILCVINPLYITSPLDHFYINNPLYTRNPLCNNNLACATLGHCANNLHALIFLRQRPSMRQRSSSASDLPAPATFSRQKSSPSLDFQ